MTASDAIIADAAAGAALSEAQALALEHACPQALLAAARARRDLAHAVVSYSPKVFIPLTQLCRDVCRYCTFARAPRELKAPYLSLDEAVAIA
ncbi:MAG: 7,8-didemethyl-8-hydroxy-5-deazariboflavin synthase, partial [Burkholderiales bacterium]